MDDIFLVCSIRQRANDIMSAAATFLRIKKFCEKIYKAQFGLKVREDDIFIAVHNQFVNNQLVFEPEAKSSAVRARLADADSNTLVPAQQTQ